MIKNKKIFIVFMIIILLFQQPIDAFAGKKAYTSYLIGDGEYVSDVVMSKKGLFGGTWAEFEIIPTGFSSLFLYNNSLSSSAFEEAMMNKPFVYISDVGKKVEYSEGQFSFTDEVFDIVTEAGEVLGDSNVLIGIAKNMQAGLMMYPTKDGSLFNNGVNQRDMDLATNVSTSITTSLNSVLQFINGGRKFENNEDLILASLAIRPGSSDLSFGTKDVNRQGFQGVTSLLRGDYVYEIYYAEDIIVQGGELDKNKDYSSASDFLKNAPTGNANGSLYTYIFKFHKEDYDFDGNGSGDVYNVKGASQYIYATPKGYKKYNIAKLNKDGVIVGVQKHNPLPSGGDAKEHPFDTKYVNIHEVSMIANYSFTVKGYSAGGVNPVSDRMNFLEKLIVGLISGLLWGLRGLLGLYTFQELLFNEGARSSVAFEGGLMDSNWWSVVMEYYLIMLAISAMLLLVAVAKIIIQTNFATVNPQLKVNLQQQIMKIFITLALMVGSVPLVRFMLEFNNLFVSIFSSQGYILDSWTRVGTYANVLAGIFIEIVLFSILVYLNVLYLMRGLILAILIASSPIFIVSMAFSTKGKGLFDNWIKEVISNIFIQSFHAFMFTFLMTVNGGARTIEQLVIIGSLIPLTKVFKNLIIPSSLGIEGISEGLSKQGIQVAKSAVKLAGAVATGGMAAGAMAGAGGASAMGGAMSSGAGASAGGNTLGNLVKSKGKQMATSQGGMSSGSKQSDSGSIMDTIGAVADLAQGVAYGDVSQSGIASNRFNKNMEGFKNSNMEKIHQMANPPAQHGVHGHKDGNANKPIRDKSQYEKRGVSNITPTHNDSGKLQMATYDLNWDNINQEDKSNFQTILDKANEYQDNPKAFNSFKKERGIRDIITNSDNTKINKIAFNADGMKQLGYRDIRKNNNWESENGEIREVYKENRYTGNNEGINLTYDFNKPLSKSENITKKGA